MLLECVTPSKRKRADWPSFSCGKQLLYFGIMPEAVEVL